MEITNPADKKLEGISLYQPIGIDHNTLVLMADHSSKPLSALKIGDVLFLGGKVTNLIKDKSMNIFNYKGNHCTGNMKILENGRWIFVADSADARRLTNNEPYDIAIVQSEVLLAMTMEYQVWSTNLEDKLEELNTKHELNSALTKAVAELK